MNPAFWYQRWDMQNIRFHQPTVNSDLIQFFPTLNIAKGATVFVPLCGKTLDMLWLEAQGYQVIGVELSERAIMDFLREHSREYAREQHDGYQTFVSDGITLICGDLFTIPKSYYEHASAVYDRAALIALPTGIRNSYVRLMRETFASRATILLITLDRDRTDVNAPPFNIDEAMVNGLYAGAFQHVERLRVTHTLNTNEKDAQTYHRTLVFAIR